jgi:23S rRNA (guanine745-N1)-methyltransferase
MTTAGDRYMSATGLPGPIVEALCCPVCRGRLRRAGGSLRCPAGHTFDIAKQGYVNLLGGPANATADTASMVADRADFLLGGHFAPLAESIADIAAPRLSDGDVVIDSGAGVGYYLGALLDRAPQAWGLALDLSAAALRRAARRHARIGAAVCDVWRPWPMRDGVAAVLIDVFAPRNGAEFRRVLRADGVLLVVTPSPAHLAELGEPAGLLAVDPRKDQRLDETLGRHFELAETRTREYPMALSGQDVRRLVAMGPAGHHPDRAPAEEPRPATVTASFLLSRYVPR